MAHPYPARHPVPSSHSQYVHSPMVTLMPDSVLYSTSKLQHINCIEQPTQEYGGIYLGDIITIVKPEIVLNHQIGAILSCLCETNYSSNLPSSLVRKIVPAKDSLDYPLNIHFDDCYTFIETMRKQKKNVLVHCHAGVSRSAAVLCAYLMKKNLWSSDQAVSFLKKRRNRVKPNQNFLKLLKQYEKQLPKILGESSNLQRTQLLAPKRQPRNSTNYYQMRNSFDSKPQRKFLNIMENQPTAQDKTSQTSKHPQSRDQFDSQQMGSRYSFRMSLMDSENRSSCHKSAHKQNPVHKKTKTVKKEELSFGEQFKNKISALLGRKTRIAWQLSSKNSNIDLEDEKVTINCI